MREGKRLFVFDLMRGVAVLLMILAHCVYFFYDRSSYFLVGAEDFGNTFCYTLFLFVAGAVTTLAYLRKEERTESTKKRLQKRLLLFLFSYYLLAIFVQFPSIVSSFGFDKLKIIFDIVTFRLLPSYTEFLPPFAIYSGLVLLLVRPLKKVIEKPLVVFFIGILLFIAGQILYGTSVPEYLIPWKAFLVGQNGFYRFPILQYSAVILIGMWWGSVAISGKLYSQKKDLVINITATLILILMLVLASTGISDFNYQTLFLRWPPSVGFILLGLIFCFGLSYVFYKYDMLQKIRLLRDFLLLLGQNAFAILWAQIIFLQIYSLAGGAKTDSILVFFLLFLLAICFSLAVATFVPFNLRLGLTFSRNSLEEEEAVIEQEMLFKFGGDLDKNLHHDAGAIRNFFLPERTGLHDKRIIKKRHLIGILFIIFVIFNFIAPMAGQEIKSQILSTKITWWSEDFAYYKQISIKNEESLSSLNKRETVNLVLNQQELLDQNKVLVDGSDIVVVYWDGKDYQDVSYVYSNTKGLNQVEISFELADVIEAKQTSSNYYLYYGNPIAQKSINSQSEIAKNNVLHKSIASLAEETPHQFILWPEKKWNLIEKNSTGKVKLSLESHEKLSNPEVTYQIFGKNVSGKFSSEGNNKWSAEVPITDLAPGKYVVQAKIVDGENAYLSQRSGFYVSYPLYFSWTLDWEGYDASTDYLNNIVQVSDNYSLPITHYFNPRIYTTDINSERKNYLTEWLKKRLQKNDVLGMHLHMFYDYVTASGVTPKKEPNGVDNGDGYGSLTTNYNEDEINKLLAYGKALFAQNGLPAPLFYRAGGWFADSTTLKSLSSNGFLADSSGRTEYKFGKNNQKGFWNLEQNAQPYYPSQVDQNRPAEENNKIGILEIPDNGADTYWFSSSELINRFKQNYNGGLLDSSKAVTFLSHPEWYKNEEMKKTEEYLNFVDQYNNKKDNGPIIYTNVDTIYNAFKN